MLAAVILVFGVAALFLILGAVGPRRTYWRLAAWQYRNPEANEPSQAGYAVSRAGYFFGAVVLAIFGFVLVGLRTDLKYDQAEVRYNADEAASALRSTRVQGLGLYSWDVEKAIAEAAGSGRLKVEDTGEGKYEVTNEDGEYPVCLTVATDLQVVADGSSVSVSASVTDGPC